MGVVTGLAWTEVGGEILKIGLSLCQVRKMQITGKLGDVMQESVKAANLIFAQKFRIWNYTANI